MSEINVEALLRERQNLFIETRAKIEAEVTAFLESLRAIEDELITPELIGLRDLTVKDVLPALWKEPFEKNVYAEELKVLSAHVNSLKVIANRLNGEALRCLQGLQ